MTLLRWFQRAAKELQPSISKGLLKRFEEHYLMISSGAAGGGRVSMSHSLLEYTIPRDTQRDKLKK